jgi:hypothetical protein
MSGTWYKRQICGTREKMRELDVAKDKAVLIKFPVVAMFPSDNGFRATMETTVINLLPDIWSRKIANAH